MNKSDVALVDVDGVLPLVVAQRLVGREVALRKSDQSTNFPLLITSVALLVGIPYLWISMLTNRINTQNATMYARGTAIAQGTNVYEGFSMPTMTPPAWMASPVPSAVPTLEQVQATYTPLPTYTPYPTLTPLVDWLRGTPVPTQNSFHPSQVNFVFSYYYPDLVGEDVVKYAANCHPDNYRFNEQGNKVIGCKDVTASGEKWSDWMLDSRDDEYRGGIAVPFHPDTCPRLLEDIVDNSCLPLYPFGTVLIVSAPAELVGKYVVVDLCPACGKYIYSHDVLFLDFLMRGLPANVTFWDAVEITEVIYP